MQTRLLVTKLMNLTLVTDPRADNVDGVDEAASDLRLQKTRAHERHVREDEAGLLKVCHE